MISSWLGLSGPGPALHSADHREQGGGVTQKPRLSSLVLFIAHSTETFIRSMDRGPASELLQMTWDQWVWEVSLGVTSLAKHWHQAWPWHGRGSPALSCSGCHLSPPHQLSPIWWTIPRSLRTMLCHQPWPAQHWTQPDAMVTGKSGTVSHQRLMEVFF